MFYLEPSAGSLPFSFSFFHPCMLIASQTNKKKLVKIKNKMCLTCWKFSPSGLLTPFQPITGYRKNSLLLQCTIWSIQHRGGEGWGRSKPVSSHLDIDIHYILPQTIICSLKSSVTVNWVIFPCDTKVFTSCLCITVTCKAMNLIWLTHCPMENATKSLRSDVPCSV